MMKAPLLASVLGLCAVGVALACCEIEPPTDPAGPVSNGLQLRLAADRPTVGGVESANLTVTWTNQSAQPLLVETDSVSNMLRLMDDPKLGGSELRSKPLYLSLGHKGDLVTLAPGASISQSARTSLMRTKKHLILAVAEQHPQVLFLVPVGCVRIRAVFFRRPVPHHLSLKWGDSSAVFWNGDTFSMPWLGHASSNDLCLDIQDLPAVWLFSE